MKPEMAVAIDRVIIDLKEELYNGALNPSITLRALSKIKSGDFSFDYSEAPPEEIAGIVKKIKIPAMQARYIEQNRENRKKYPNLNNILYRSDFELFGADPISTEDTNVEIYNRTCSIAFVEWLNLFPGDLGDKLLTRSQIIHVLNESVNDFYLDSHIFCLAKRREKLPSTEDNLVIVIAQRRRDDGKLYLDYVRDFKQGDPYKRYVERMFIIPQII
ncbi:MAG: hypothetical protein NUV82_00675 [Candidatus Komeilibacteria bacterium]|nr:hypothetical protein [Candidatus Komeilibacteria bacterium]